MLQQVTMTAGMTVNQQLTAAAAAAALRFQATALTALG
jgi:hypothetical protein